MFGTYFLRGVKCPRCPAGETGWWNGNEIVENEDGTCTHAKVVSTRGNAMLHPVRPSLPPVVGPSLGRYTSSGRRFGFAHFSSLLRRRHVELSRRRRRSLLRSIDRLRTFKLDIYALLCTCGISARFGLVECRYANIASWRNGCFHVSQDITTWREHFDTGGSSPTMPRRSGTDGCARSARHADKSSTQTFVRALANWRRGIEAFELSSRQHCGIARRHYSSSCFSDL